MPFMQWYLKLLKFIMNTSIDKKPYLILFKKLIFNFHKFWQNIDIILKFAENWYQL
jgi:hypothetical protein